MHDTSRLSPEAEAFLTNNSPTRIPLPINGCTAKLIRRIGRRPFEASVRAALDSFPGRVRDVRIDGVEVAALDPHPTSSPDDGNYLVYVHGGAWVLGDAVDAVITQLSEQTRLPAFSVRYPLVPEARYPVARDQCLDVWRHLTRTRAGRPVLVGTSAGANIALALLQRLMAGADQETLPAAVVLLTPATDLAEINPARAANEGVDPVLRWTGFVNRATRAYRGDVPADDPGLSPVRADWKALSSPVLITTGTRDLLRSDSRRLEEAMRRAGVAVTLQDAEGLWHAYQARPELPEARASIRAIAEFIGRSLPAGEGAGA